MTAPRKKRKPGRPGRPPGSKDKVKRVRRPRAPKPEPISEDLTPDEYAQHVGALQDIPPEMSFVAKCFGLDQLAGGVIGQPIVDSAERILAGNRELASNDVLVLFKESELAVVPAIDFSPYGTPCDPASGWGVVSVESETTEELKSILRTVSSMMTNLASYPMDHGLRCGMNEIEILLSKNREKFQK